MAYDEALASRVRDLLDKQQGLTERRMFGGLAWLVHGNMAVVVRGKGGLLVRVDPGAHDALLKESGAATMVMRGRQMRGWITVTPQACDKSANLARWVDRGLSFARSLPPQS